MYKTYKKTCFYVAVSVMLLLCLTACVNAATVDSSLDKEETALEQVETVLQNAIEEHPEIGECVLSINIMTNELNVHIKPSNGERISSGTQKAIHLLVKNSVSPEYGFSVIFEDNSSSIPTVEIFGGDIPLHD